MKHLAPTFFKTLGLAAALVIGAQPAYSTNYYFSPSGKDTNVGTTSAAPWASIAKASALDLRPGDQILLEAGKTFSGNMFFGTTASTVADAGTATNPVVISTYNGADRAVIVAGAKSAIDGLRTGGFAISNLTIVGSGQACADTEPQHGNACEAGIRFINPKSGAYSFAGISINNVVASGFQNGVLIAGINGNSGFNGTRITNSEFFGNYVAGIKVQGPAQYLPHSNMYIGNVSVHDNFGNTKFQSGMGILVTSVDGLVIEHCVAYRNGVKDGKPNARGNVGIMLGFTNNALVQYNEAYGQMTTGEDGDGFDFDYGVNNSVMQYNYSHDNYGSGVLLANVGAGFNANNLVVRYNVSQNDGHMGNHGGIRIWGRVTNTQIYGNTVYLDAAVNKNPSSLALSVHNSGAATEFVSNVFFRNNLLVTRGTSTLLGVPTQSLAGDKNLRFEANLYDSGATPFRVTWGASAYTSLAAWRTASGQETFASVATGIDGDSALAAGGQAGTVSNSRPLSSLTEYRLQGSSAAIGAGLSYDTFGIDLKVPGVVIPVSLGSVGAPLDFCGKAVVSTNVADVGACQFDPVHDAAPELASVQLVESATENPIPLVNGTVNLDAIAGKDLSLKATPGSDSAMVKQVEFRNGAAVIGTAETPYKMPIDLSQINPDSSATFAARPFSGVGTPGPEKTMTITFKKSITVELTELRVVDATTGAVLLPSLLLKPAAVVDLSQKAFQGRSIAIEAVPSMGATVNSAAFTMDGTTQTASAANSLRWVLDASKISYGHAYSLVATPAATEVTGAPLFAQLVILPAPASPSDLASFQLVDFNEKVFKIALDATKVNVVDPKPYVGQSFMLKVVQANSKKLKKVTFTEVGNTKFSSADTDATYRANLGAGNMLDGRVHVLVATPTDATGVVGTPIYVVLQFTP